jgi:phosphotransferase system enzyme I (PtsI)
VTQDGAQVELFGNIGKPEDAKLVNECDGEGVGLFRTEFLFMGASSIPTEEEQFEAYKKAAVTLEGKTVIIRTLDVGGDKEIPYLGLEKEDNPFLGFRAVRYCLQNEAVYKPQLRALLRASAFGDVRIMVPLVTCVDEIRAVKELVKTYMSELDREGIAYNPDIQVGVMIETPAASLIADVLAKEADFFSIGTNDLTQYTMAVDRGNAKVAYLYSPFQPAVLRSIKHIITCAKKEGISVGMCGEAAADPLLIPLLVAWGLDEFSVTPATVLATRKAIHQVNYKMAEKIDAAVLNCTTEQEVVEILKRMC